MECQTITKNLKINKEKSIGEIIIVVEGESEEFKLLKHIFTNILDYNYIPLKRNKTIKDSFKSKTNKNSTVIVANTSNSNIKSIITDNDYKDKLYSLISKEYHKSLKNTPIYILWDRDRESNEKEFIKKSLETFSNSLDNDNYEMNGLLLLSYPCIETYEISNFNKRLWKKTFISSKEAKQYKKELSISMENITEKTLLLALENMHKILLEFGILTYDPSNFKSINNRIFNKIEEIYKHNKYMIPLSLISIMLVDLKIIDYK